VARSRGAHAAPKPAGNVRSRKIRALLASGLVLGVGATLTLSSWNDSEYVGGELQAGSFGIEGSPTGQDGTYRSSTDGPSHALTFEPEAGQMYPGYTTYALFSVRAQSGSLGGTIQVQPPQWDRENTASLGQYLDYGISVVDGTVCDESAFEASTEPVVGSGTSLSNSEPAATEQNLAADGTPVNYCIELTLHADASSDAQGQSVTPQWQFLGTSTVDE